MNKRRTAVGGHTHQTKNKKPQAAQWKLTRPAQLEKKWLVHDQKNKLQMEEPLTGLLSCFFPSVTADLALRLGPDSVQKIETLWLPRHIMEQKQREQTKNGNSDDPQISRYVLVLAPFTGGPVLEKAGWMGPFGGKFH